MTLFRYLKTDKSIQIFTEPEWHERVLVWQRAFGLARLKQHRYFTSTLHTTSFTDADFSLAQFVDARVGKALFITNIVKRKKSLPLQQSLSTFINVGCLVL